MRESPAALGRADAIVIDGAADEADLSAWPCAQFTLRRALGDPVPLDPGGAPPARDARVIALAGIASPARFTDALGAAGWSVARTLSYPDHHRYRAADVQTVAAAVRETGAAAVLTTEKDAVRLLAWRPLPVPVPVCFVPLTAHPEPAAEFDAWLFGRLEAARR